MLTAKNNYQEFLVQITRTCSYFHIWTTTEYILLNFRFNIHVSYAFIFPKNVLCLCR